MDNLKERIVVVGNGPSVLNTKYGDLIDSFGSVVRFNNFVTEGYEEYVGRRTDILCRRSCDDVKLYDHETLRSVLCFVTYCRWSEGMLQVSKQVKQYYGPRCTIIGLKKCKFIGEEVGLDQPYNEWASVGVLALGYFRDLFLTKQEFCDRIVIHGFDGLTPNCGHYFTKAPKDAKFHNAGKELDFIKSLNLKTLKEIE